MWIRFRGFVGRADYELIVRWHQACAFVPLYRMHKDKGASEAEIFNLPSKYRNEIKKAIELRHKFLPYLWHLCWKAHLECEPIIRPICYEFQDDEDCYYIEDEYLVGPSLLFAPILEKGKEEREVYLPDCEWINFWNGEITKGKKWVKVKDEMPIFIRKDSAIPIENGLIIFGEGEWNIYHGDKGEIAHIIFKDNVFKQENSKLNIKEIIILGKKIYSNEFLTQFINIGTKIIVNNETNQIRFFNK